MPIKLNYEQAKKPEARRMRNNMTPEEKKLWFFFLKKYPVQFKRQKQFGPFIVDFYCSRAMLVVEIDGNQHYTPQGLTSDQERTWYLENLGLKVLRVKNEVVRDHFNNVCFMIDQAVQTRLKKE